VGFATLGQRQAIGIDEGRGDHKARRRNFAVIFVLTKAPRCGII